MKYFNFLPQQEEREVFTKAIADEIIDLESLEIEYEMCYQEI